MLRRLILASIALLQVYSSAEYVRGCYYVNSAQYRPGKGKYTPQDYQSGLCTHIFYAFAVLNQDYTIKIYEWNDPGDNGMYSQVVGWKNQQPGLKVLLSFAGAYFSTGNLALIRTMVSTAQNRQIFVKSVQALLTKYSFDGFDVDWEFPLAEDKANYAKLLRDLRKGLDPKLLLTAAVPGNPTVIQAGFDGKAMAETLNLVSIMSYDFHGVWEKNTGHNSPLFDKNGDRFSIKDAAAAWEAIGVPKSKLVIGLAPYGHGWTLAGSDTSVGASATGAAANQPFSNESGVISYYEACDLLAAGGKRFYDEKQESPYLVSGNQWFSYDDVQSIKAKSNWVVKNGYAGAFVWSLDLDDFKGSSCKDTAGQKYPLINTIKSVLTGTVGPVVGTTKPSVTVPTASTKATQGTTPKATVPPVTTKPGGAFVCPAFGAYPIAKVCTSYYMCESVGAAPVKMPCPAGLEFNAVSKVCDWPASAKCVA